MRVVAISSPTWALGEIVRVEGADRIALRARSTGELLDGSSFNVVDWGGGAFTLRDAATGRYLSVQDDGSLAADREVLKTWFINETFRLEPVPGGVVLRNVRTGRFAAVDPVDGRLSVTAETPAAECWERELLHDGTAEARAAAEDADVAIMVLGNHPLINGRETEDRRDLAPPAGQEALLRTVAEIRPEIVTMSSYRS
ncbi:glycoside hydrolase family 3 C-terminal domain-containing protein [Nonomuraea sp. 10N515B]|uniref:glycoside hydrolase family 3 C-terminal domain-containing protein n=1 Tax=Nonomuraea sp. 10N515B TaxID=3457422 RepID=UPI003FCC7E75